jgi:hypothetical protein
VGYTLRIGKTGAFLSCAVTTADQLDRLPGRSS